MCLKQGGRLVDCGSVFFCLFSRIKSGPETSLNVAANCICCPWQVGEASSVCHAASPSWVGSPGFTWTALLAPQSFLQQPVAPTRLLRMGTAANRAPVSPWKRVMGRAQPLTKNISWCGCVVRAASQLQMQISSTAILWQRWRSKRRTLGGKYAFDNPKLWAETFCLQNQAK